MDNKNYTSPSAPSPLCLPVAIARQRFNYYFIIKKRSFWCYNNYLKLEITNDYYLINYKNGILEGTFKSYYKTGRVTEILNYKGGKLHGNTKRFADNGALLDDLNYCNGKLEGIAKYYNVDGELIYTGNYANDEKVGEWEYYENGKKENVNKLKQ